jgi:hypothetical protein
MTSSANPCQAFFEQYAQNPKERAERLQQTGQALQWEKLSASPHSPGPVKDQEQVIRLVINPIHVADDGSVTPMLMSDVKDKGGSVERLAYASREQTIASGRAHAEAKNTAAGPSAKPRSIYGTVTLSVQEIREVVVATQARAFGVFDTAKEVSPSHADIFQIVAGNGQEARSARLQLWQLAIKGFSSAN